MPTFCLIQFFSTEYCLLTSCSNRYTHLTRIYEVHSKSIWLFFSTKTNDPWAKSFDVNSCTYVKIFMLIGCVNSQLLCLEYWRVVHTCWIFAFTQDVMKDCCVTIQEIAHKVGISTGSVFSILTEDLYM